MGEQSFLQMNIKILEYNIMHEYTYINNTNKEDMFQRQWSTLSFVSNKLITFMEDSPDTMTFADLTDGNKIQGNLEFCYFKNYYTDSQYTASPDSVNLTTT
jgi:hypothetical protein